MDREYKTTRELATYLRCSTRTVERQREKEVPFKKFGNKFLFEKGEVEAWIARNGRALSAGGSKK